MRKTALCAARGMMRAWYVAFAAT